MLRTVILITVLIFYTGRIIAQVGGCQADISVNGTTAFCAGDSRVLTVTSGQTYLWSTGDTTQSIEVTQSGVYSVTVTDSVGCISSSGQSIAVVPPLETAVVPNNTAPYCIGDTIVLTALGIPVLNQFEWSTGETTQSITVTQTGIYSVQISNSIGCTSEASVPIGFLPLPNSTIQANGPLAICSGDALELSVLNVPFSVDYQWSTGSSNQTISVFEAGIYSVLVTSILGCTSSSFLEISELPLPDVELGLDQFLCAGETVLITAHGADYYNWPNGFAGDTLTVVAEVDTTIIVSGMNAGCTQIDSGMVQLYVEESPSADFTFGNTYLGDPIAFENSSTGGILVNWSWSFGDGETGNGPNVVHSYNAPGNYYVTLIGTTENNCADTAQKSIEVSELLLLPNVITPNIDGINDVLDVYSSYATKLEMIIYNRWGHVVWFGEGKHLKFTGKTDAGVQLVHGTYFRTVVVHYPDGNKSIYEDFIEILD